jgi:hypothetical protein
VTLLLSTACAPFRAIASQIVERAVAKVLVNVIRRSQQRSLPHAASRSRTRTRTRTRSTAIADHGAQVVVGTLREFSSAVHGAPCGSAPSAIARTSATIARRT